MTTPEIEPALEQYLRDKSDSRASQQMGPVDIYANNYIDVILHNDEKSSELSERATQLISRIVGWSTKNLDLETGCVPIAKLDLGDPQDLLLDKLVVNFLSGSRNIQVSMEATEKDTVDRFEFTQPRKSGNIQAVTVHRKVPLEPTENDNLEYFIKFTDLGKPHPSPETLLEQGREWLESTLPAKVAQAAMEKTVGVKDRIKNVGRGLVLSAFTDRDTPKDS